MRKIGKLLVLIICITVMIITGYKIYDYMFGEENDFSEIRSGGVDLNALHKNNKDIVGWIKIDGTRIDYPVMQRKGSPEFYLRKNFKKQYSESGTPFLQYDSKIGKSKNYLIYGHNMKTGYMFHDLLKYKEHKFYKKHKIIHFETLKEGKCDYEVISAFKTETYNFNYSNFGKIIDDKTYSKYMGIIKSLNGIKTNKKAQYPHQLITLATCSYHVDDHCGRFLVVGRKI